MPFGRTPRALPSGATIGSGGPQDRARPGIPDFGRPAAIPGLTGQDVVKAGAEAAPNRHRRFGRFMPVPIGAGRDQRHSRQTAQSFRGGMTRDPYRDGQWHRIRERQWPSYEGHLSHGDPG